MTYSCTLYQILNVQYFRHSIYNVLDVRNKRPDTGDQKFLCTSRGVENSNVVSGKGLLMWWGEMAPMTVGQLFKWSRMIHHKVSMAQVGVMSTNVPQSFGFHFHVAARNKHGGSWEKEQMDRYHNDPTTPTPTLAITSNSGISGHGVVSTPWSTLSGLGGGWTRF